MVLRSRINWEVSGIKCSIFWIKWHTPFSQVTKESFMNRTGQSREKIPPAILWFVILVCSPWWQSHLKLVLKFLTSTGIWEGMTAFNTVHFWHFWRFEILLHFLLCNYRIYAEYLRKMFTLLHRQQTTLLMMSTGSA